MTDKTKEIPAEELKRIKVEADFVFPDGSPHFNLMNHGYVHGAKAEYLRAHSSQAADQSALVQKLKEYIDFLGKEVSDNAVFMHLHNCSTPQATIDRGIQLRKEIADLEQSIPSVEPISRSEAERAFVMGYFNRPDPPASFVDDIAEGKLKEAWERCKSFISTTIEPAAETENYNRQDVIDLYNLYSQYMMHATFRLSFPDWMAEYNGDKRNPRASIKQEESRAYENAWKTLNSDLDEIWNTRSISTAAKPDDIIKMVCKAQEKSQKSLLAAMQPSPPSIQAAETVEVQRLRGLLLEIGVRAGIFLPTEEWLIDLFDAGFGDCWGLLAHANEMLYDNAKEIQEQTRPNIPPEYQM